MAGMFNDDSTDDEIGVNLQLAERLRINRGDNSSFGDGQKFENSKDFKQFYNIHRKKFAQDGRSSSSSSDNPLSGIISSDIYHNKKRQNGDKNMEQLANPKRTCLSDRYRKLPDWRDLKKKSSSNGYQCEQSKCLEPFHLQSPDIFSNKKSEDQINSLADAEDSDFEIPKFSRNGKKDCNHSSKVCKSQTSVPKTVHFQNHDEPVPSTSYMNNLFESGSDEEARGICKNGALKGGRQEPSDGTYYAKRLFGRKVNKKILDSDESEDDNWQSCYRSTKPLVYSSSDSEDFNKSNDKNKHASNDTTSNGSSSQSLSCDGFERSSLHPPRQSKSVRSNQKFSKKSACLMPPYRADSSDSCDRQFHSSDFNRKTTPNRPCRARRSPRINMATNMTSNGFNSASNISSTTRGRRLGGSERGTRRSGSPHHRNIRSQYRDHDSKCTRGRSVSAARPQKDVSNFASRYPDIFDAEESENEFFTANSYSDTETSTESLGGLATNGKFSNHRTPLTYFNCEQSRLEELSTDDEISVVFSSAPHGRNCESRRGGSRTLGRRYNRGGTPHRQLQNTQEVVSLSPDPVEQVRQVEEDERIARMLQEQFDAELDPDFTPINHDVMVSRDDSDDEIIDPVLDDSDSDGGRAYPPYTTFSRRPFRARYPNRPGTPTFSAAIFFSPRRNDRNRRRFQTSREQRSDWQLARLFGLGLAVPAIFDGEDDYETLLSLDLNGEVVPRGLQKTQINRLPTRKYIHPNSSGSSEMAHKRAELNKECQVCLTDYETGDILRILPCFHEFHTPCIDPWLKINHTCPVCRVAVDLDT